jgi:hypothetical protein
MRREQLKEMERIERRLAELTRARQEFKLMQQLNKQKVEHEFKVVNFFQERYSMDAFTKRKRYLEYSTPTMSDVSEFSDVCYHYKDK